MEMVGGIQKHLYEKHVKAKIICKGDLEKENG